MQSNRDIKTVVDSLTIGSKCFIVHKDYAFKKKNGGRIVPARVKTFINRKGNIIPEFSEIGNAKRVMDMKTYIPFVTVQDAIDAIKS